MRALIICDHVKANALGVYNELSYPPWTDIKDPNPREAIIGDGSRPCFSEVSDDECHHSDAKTNALGVYNETTDSGSETPLDYVDSPLILAIDELNNIIGPLSFARDRFLLTNQISRHDLLNYLDIIDDYLETYLDYIINMMLDNYHPQEFLSYLRIRTMINDDLLENGDIWTMTYYQILLTNYSLSLATNHVHTYYPQPSTITLPITPQHVTPYPLIELLGFNAHFIPFTYVFLEHIEESSLNSRWCNSRRSIGSAYCPPDNPDWEVNLIEQPEANSIGSYWGSHLPDKFFTSPSTKWELPEICPQLIPIQAPPPTTILSPISTVLKNVYNPMKQSLQIANSLTSTYALATDTIPMDVYYSYHKYYALKNLMTLAMNIRTGDWHKLSLCRLFSTIYTTFSSTTYVSLASYIPIITALYKSIMARQTLTLYQNPNLETYKNWVQNLNYNHENARTPPSQHSHPNANMLRQACRDKIRSMLLEVGIDHDDTYSLYNGNQPTHGFQNHMSVKDAENPLQTQDLPYIHSFRAAHNQINYITVPHNIKLLTVILADSYFDVSNFFYTGLPILVVNHNYSKFCDKSKDYTRTNVENQNITSVNGGARYLHNNYDYSKDHLTSTFHPNNYFETPIKQQFQGQRLSYNYRVHRHNTAEYQFIFLLPSSVQNALAHAYVPEPLLKIEPYYELNGFKANLQIINETVFTKDGSRTRNILYYGQPYSSVCYADDWDHVVSWLGVLPDPTKNLGEVARLGKLEYEIINYNIIKDYASIIKKNIVTLFERRIIESERSDHNPIHDHNKYKQAMRDIDTIRYDVIGPRSSKYITWFSKSLYLNTTRISETSTITLHPEHTVLLPPTITKYLPQKQQISATNQIKRTEPLMPYNMNHKSNHLKQTAHEPDNFYQMHDQHKMIPIADTQPLLDHNYTSKQVKHHAATWDLMIDQHITNNNVNATVLEQCELGKPSLTPIFPLFTKLAPVSVPYANDNAQRQAVGARLFGVNTDTNQLLTNNPHMIATITMIITKLFKPAVKLTHDELLTHCTGNLKKRILRILEGEETITRDSLYDEQLNNSFIKKELHTKVSSAMANRNISNVQDAITVAMSEYTIPLSKQLADLVPGYAFGHSRRDIDNYMHILSRSYNFVIETDFSAFDGTQNSLTNLIEKMIYQHVYNNEDILELKDYQTNTTFNAGVFTYTTMYTRLSGAADTSLMNTIINLMVCQLTYHHIANTNPPQFIEPTNESVKQASARCVIGGDDGAYYGLSKQSLITIVEALHLVIKAEEKSTSKPINMLARTLQTPTTNTSSTPSLTRFASKLAYTANHQFTRPEALYLKLTSAMTTDFDHPIITPFCQELLTLLTPCVRPSVWATKRHLIYRSYGAEFGQPYQLGTEEYSPIDDADNDIMLNMLRVTELAKLQNQYNHANSIYDLSLFDLSFLDLTQTNTTTPSDKPPIVPNYMEYLSKITVHDSTYYKSLPQIILPQIMSDKTYSKYRPYLDKNNEDFYDYTPGPGTLYKHLNRENYRGFYHDPKEKELYQSLPNTHITNDKFMTTDYQIHEIIPVIKGNATHFIDLPFSMTDISNKDHMTTNLIIDKLERILFSHMQGDSRIVLLLPQTTSTILKQRDHDLTLISYGQACSLIIKHSAGYPGFTTPQDRKIQETRAIAQPLLDYDTINTIMRHILINVKQNNTQRHMVESKLYRIFEPFNKRIKPIPSDITIDKSTENEEVPAADAIGETETIIATPSKTITRIKNADMFNSTTPTSKRREKHKPSKPTSNDSNSNPVDKPSNDQLTKGKTYETKTNTSRSKFTKKHK
nr:MAG: RNA-dependent RNA polymerase [Riboviria sp.]